MAWASLLLTQRLAFYLVKRALVFFLGMVTKRLSCSLVRLSFARV